MQNSTETDLDWLAFRYISGEMGASESEQFESLLADDQTARDAVVRAVELSQTILAAQSVGSTSCLRIDARQSVSQQWLQHITWISTSVAALLLIALALNFNDPASPSGSDSDNVASVWAERSTEPATDPPTLNGSGSDEEEFVTADPPNWMLEAVRSLHGDEVPESEDSADEEMES
jgi:hypothetical protein